jgi:hypothetical protein
MWRIEMNKRVLKSNEMFACKPWINLRETCGKEKRNEENPWGQEVRKRFGDSEPTESRRK